MPGEAPAFYMEKQKGSSSSRAFSGHNDCTVAHLSMSEVRSRALFWEKVAKAERRLLREWSTMATITTYLPHQLVSNTS